MSYVVSSFPFVLFFSVFSLSFVLSVKKSCLGKNKYYYSIKIYSARWLKRIKYIYNVKLNTLCAWNSGEPDVNGKVIR